MGIKLKAVCLLIGLLVLAGGASCQTTNTTAEIVRFAEICRDQSRSFSGKLHEFMGSRKWQNISSIYSLITEMDKANDPCYNMTSLYQSLSKNTSKIEILSNSTCETLIKEAASRIIKIRETFQDGLNFDKMAESFSNTIQFFQNTSENSLAAACQIIQAK